MKRTDNLTIILFLCLLAYSSLCWGQNTTRSVPGEAEEDAAGLHLYAEQIDMDKELLEDLEDDDLEFLEEDETKIAISDPLEPVNRAVFYFNDKFYFWLLKPVSEGYSFVVPEGVRVAISNFFNHVATPVRVVNNLLQLKVKAAGTELARFGINSTFGMLGFYDVAKSEMNINMEDEDFGQTLGAWGMGPVMYINLPVLGPSSIRDSIGLAGDYFLDPVNYIEFGAESIAINTGRGINRASLSIGNYEELKKDAIDPYFVIRDVYFQYRESKIKR